MPPPRTRQLNVTAAILAWLWPGLGHASLGYRRRGGLIMLGVLMLVLGGLLIGGVDCVDRRRDRLWFLAQAFCGPIVFAADLANQQLTGRLPDDWRGDDRWRQQYRRRDPEALAQLRVVSLGKVNEIGTLYIALAGLMNLVVVLDALHLAPRGEGPP